MWLQWRRIGLAILFLALCEPPVVEGRYAVIPRQDTRSANTVSTSISPQASPSSNPKSTHRDDSSAVVSTSALPGTEPKSKPSMPADGSSTLRSSSSISARTTTAPTATISSLILPSNSTVNGVNKLPIEPTITPALSVAGAILMLTGLFYTLIGIKTKWLHIFFSTTYLISLAVTVLIVYVMHPPVSNAIQGAYFVAAFVTGVIFGGGSVIFADVTEGLGCLLGGFSLAMWFLVLSPGGLIQSTAGKSIFIACFTLGIFGFFISHWTRAYALIGATSFAGATVIVLGIDCFSRAGLKEFWLYIWGKNNPRPSRAMISHFSLNDY